MKLHKILKLFIASLPVLSITAFSPASANNTKGTLQKADIDLRVEKIIKSYGNPSLNVGIVVNGELAFHHAYGVMDMDTDEKAKPDAVYQIASVTKTFAGTLAAILTEEGIVDLDAPISTYDPEIAFHEDIDGSKITLRRLLTHTSGLHSITPNRRNIIPPPNLPKGYDPTIAEPYSIAELYEAITSYGLAYPTGEGHQYSNFAFNIAGHILAKASGFDTFESAIQAKVLGPLGMKDSGVTLTKQQIEKLPTHYVYIKNPGAYGDEFKGKHHYKTPYWRLGEVSSGGGLASTVPDLARYLAALSAPDTLKVPLLGEKGYTILLETDHEYIRRSRAPYHQALGWRSISFGTYGPVHGHTGHLDGHHAYIAFSKEHRVGVIVLTNGAYESMELLGNRLMLYALNTVSSTSNIKLIPAF